MTGIWKIRESVVMMLRSSVSVEEVSLVYRRMCLRGHPSRGGSPKDYLKLQAVGSGQRQVLEKATLTSFVGVSHLIVLSSRFIQSLKDQCDTITRFFLEDRQNCDSDDKSPQSIVGILGISTCFQ